MRKTCLNSYPMHSIVPGAGQLERAWITVVTLPWKLPGDPFQIGHSKMEWPENCRARAKPTHWGTTFITKQLQCVLGSFTALDLPFHYVLNPYNDTEEQEFLGT